MIVFSVFQLKSLFQQSIKKLHFDFFIFEGSLLFHFYDLLLFDNIWP